MILSNNSLKNKVSDDNRNKPFVDEFTKELIEQRDSDEFTLPLSLQNKYYEASKDFANNLMRLHGLQPLNRKKAVARKYTGKGYLSIQDIVQSSIMNGEMKLIERRKVRLNPERPSVALIQDVSSSMTRSRVKRGAILLGASFVEFFGRGFAQRFDYTEIGAYDSGVKYLKNATYEKTKREIISSSYGQNGTKFTPAFNCLEFGNFYAGNENKFIFLITDGDPESYFGINISTGNSTEGVNDPIGQLQRDIASETIECKKLVKYIEERWNKRENIEYFWIQLGSYANIFRFIQARFNYVTPKYEQVLSVEPDLTIPQYTQIKSSTTENYKTFLGEFYWKAHLRGDMIYMTPEQMIDGSGIHRMMDSFAQKFKRKFKT